MTRRKHSWAVVLGAIAIGAAGLALLPSEAIAERCDGKAIPCPLQKWMRTNAGTPMASGDLATLAKTMEAARKFGAPEMTNWSKMAKKAADDAAAGKTDDVKADCKACHDAYKDEYKKKESLRNQEIR